MKVLVKGLFAPMVPFIGIIRPGWGDDDDDDE